MTQHAASTRTAGPEQPAFLVPTLVVESSPAASWRSESVRGEGRRGGWVRIESFGTCTYVHWLRRHPDSSAAEIRIRILAGALRMCTDAWTRGAYVAHGAGIALARLSVRVVATASVLSGYGREARRGAAAALGPPSTHPIQRSGLRGDGKPCALSVGRCVALSRRAHALVRAWWERCHASAGRVPICGPTAGARACLALGCSARETGTTTYIRRRTRFERGGRRRY